MIPDGELLRRYTETNSESAFSELVERHLALVYSAALRQVNGDAHLAQDVAQTVFADLARKAVSLANRPVLTGWLYTSAHFAAAKAVRTEQRRHTREQEAHLMNQLLSNPAPDLDWEQLRPVLDAAMLELNETDREAVLLRYFNNRPHAEIAERLGLSENAARTRVERAVEKLHTLLSSRGVSTTAALSVVISANAVQLAPAGLAITVSSTAALAGTSLATATTATAVKTLAMTTLQKTLITATIAAAVGTGIYEARQASTLRTQVQTLRLQQAPVAEQNQQLIRERDDAARQLAALRDENERLNRNTTELLRLRGEVARLRSNSQELAFKRAAGTNGAANTDDPIESEAKTLTAKALLLKKLFEQMPDKKIAELQYLGGGQVWLNAAQTADLETDAGISKALSDLRQKAKQTFVSVGMIPALNQFVKANAGQLPTDVFQLKSYLRNIPVDDETLQRYQITKTGNVSDLQPGDKMIAEKAPVDDQHDTLFQIGLRTWSWQGIGANKDNNGSGGY